MKLLSTLPERARRARRATTCCLVAVLALAVAPAAATAEPVDRATPAVPALRIPAPTGPLPVSTEILHLVDHARRDPWRPRTGPRELMVTMTYPARRGGPPARYTTPAESRAYLAFQEAQGGALPEDLPRDVLAEVRVGASAGRPPLPRAGGRPLVVLSPGFSLHRSSLTGLATELASRGYVVVSVDHTFEAAGISLPGGRLARCAACDVEDYGRIAPHRVDDVSFVLDRLLGRRPAWRGTRVIDPRRIAMVGHSIGGNSAGSALATDPRVDAAVNLDGTFFDPTPRRLYRPMMLLGTRDLHRPGGDDRTWPRTWRRLAGPRAWFTVAGGVHFSFVDYPVLLDQLGLGDPEAALGGRRSLRITRALVRGFLGRHLHVGRAPDLGEIADRFPEVRRHRPS